MDNQEQSTKKPDVTIAGVGASAGGLEALQEMISHLPEELDNLALVIAQHLSPTYKSMLVQLLSRQTKIPVVEIKSNISIEPNKIYITPPDSELTVMKGRLMLSKPSQGAGPKPSVDSFFTSLSRDRGANAIGIILSGTGSDGKGGIKAIKAAGGITVAQEPQTAKYDGMPIAAIETGQVDLVLSPDRIGEELQEVLRYKGTNFMEQVKIHEGSSSFDAILELLSKRSGTDFSNYKSSTILRRLDKRLAELKIESVNDYLTYVKDRPLELDTLFNTILIGVTTFFRDKEAFETIDKYIAKIVASKSRGEQIRIWVAGCATGEEAYSIGLLLAKHMGDRLQDFNIQIFATDIDEQAIAIARKGIYPEKLFLEVPEDLLQKYTIAKNGEREISKMIRQLILFSKHDVTNNPPFLKLDMISCRNLLIYFGSGLQQHVIPLFHYALNPGGYLFLGKSETVGQFTDLFATVEGKAKVFQRKRSNKQANLRFGSFSNKSGRQQREQIQQKKNSKLTIPEMVKETFYNSFDYPYVVIDANMDVLQISGDVRMFLGIYPGTMNTNILKLAHKDLQIDLRALITNTIKNNEVSKGDIRKMDFFDKDYFVRISVKPVLFADPENPLFLVVFETHDAKIRLFSQYSEETSNSEDPRVMELETELSSVKEHMQTFIEELETANEELQSLNEELQSSNEELQSSNEELETSNEELQSTNEELQIAYAELKTASEEVEKQNKQAKSAEANAKALLNNTLQAFVLINREYKIITFNSTANQRAILLFNKAMKTGDPIIDFQPEGGIEKFHRDFNKALKGNLVHGETLVELKHSYRRWYKYTFTPVENEDGEVEVVSYSTLDITDQKRVENELLESEKLVNSVFNCADIGICVTNQEGQFVKVNQAYCEIYGYAEDELIDQDFTMVLPPEKRDYAKQLHHDYLEGKPESAGMWEVMSKTGERIKIRVTAARMILDDGRKYKVTSIAPIKK